MSKNMIPPILITGAARSGTSMTAGIIDHCGAFGGITSGPNSFNKKGMFENAEIRDKIVKPYLRLMGVDPKGQKPLPVLKMLMPLADLDTAVENIFHYSGYKEGPWYYKGAKMCLIWPLWQKAFPEAKWVIVRRDTEDIANSCMRTTFMNKYRTVEDWKGWVEEHKLRFQEMREAGMDIREVWPSKLIEGDFTEIREVIDWLGLEWQEKAALDFISPDLWKKGRS